VETALRSRDGSPHVTDERFNTVSHLFAACFALVGAALLIVQAADQGDAWKIVGFSVYGLSIVTLFVSSAAHHGIDGGPRVNEVLRTLDYSSVFLLIAGSVTPLVLVLFRTAYGWTVLMAASGLIYSVGFVLFVIEKPNPWPGVFGFHEIWHLMVVLAALLHYLLLTFYVLPA